jgi:hypothetical protein
MNRIKTRTVAGADAPHGIIIGGRAPCYESAFPFGAHPTRGGSQRRCGKTGCAQLVFSHERDSWSSARTGLNCCPLAFQRGVEDPDRRTPRLKRLLAVPLQPRRKPQLCSSSWEFGGPARRSLPYRSIRRTARQLGMTITFRHQVLLPWLALQSTIRLPFSPAHFADIHTETVPSGDARETGHWQELQQGPLSSKAFRGNHAHTSPS